MLLATCSIVLPAIARLPIASLPGFLVVCACVLASVTVDGLRHRRMRHPASGWRAPLPIASPTLAFFGATTHAWSNFGTLLFA